jgi:hypothetical protein
MTTMGHEEALAEIERLKAQASADLMEAARLMREARDAERKAWARLYDANDDVWCQALGSMSDKRDVAPWREKREAAIQALRDLGVDMGALFTWMAPPPPEPGTPKERDRAACEEHLEDAMALAASLGDDSESAWLDDAKAAVRNWTLAIRMHDGVDIEATRAELHRRYDLLADYLMLRGGTTFVNACAKAIAEERWGDLVSEIVRLEHYQVADGVLRWARGADDQRIAIRARTTTYRLPPSVEMPHPFD